MVIEVTPTSVNPDEPHVKLRVSIFAVESYDDAGNIYLRGLKIDDENNPIEVHENATEIDELIDQAVQKYGQNFFTMRT